MTSLRLALTELKRFSSGVLPKLVMLAVCLIPLLYGGIYLYSNWDPYGKVDRVTGALVMEDQGATQSDGTRMNTGQDVAKNLKDSADFDWKDVSTRDQAVQEVTDGDVDFALVIPEDFSEKLLSTSRFQPSEDGTPGEVDPQQAGMEVITNDANNYILTNIVTKAGTTIRDSVAQQVGDETANQLLASFTKIHGQLADATDGSQQVTDGSVKLGDAIDQLKDGTSELASGSVQLDDGAQQLADAEDQLVDGQQQGLDGVRQLDDGARTLDEGAGTLTDGTGQLADGSHQLKDGTATLASGATQLKDGTAQLSSGATQLKDGTAQLSTGASKLNDGVTQLDQTLQASGIGEVGANIAQVCQDLSAINDYDPTGRLATDVSDAVISEVRDSVTEQVDALVKEGIISQENRDKVIQRMTDDQVRERINRVTAKGLDDFETTDLGKQLTQFRDSTCASNGQSEIAGKIDQLTSGVSQLHDGSSELAEGASTLDQKTGELADGASTLDQKTGELAEGASTLDQKTGELADGADQVDDGARQLKDGTTQLRSGTGELLSGSQQLYDGQVQARDGAKQLAEGTSQAVSGSRQLDDGAGQLQDGSGELTDGSEKLTDGLRDGTNQVPNLSQNQQEDLSGVMSDPVSDDHDSLASARNYGEGMGPFFMCLALWIGVLMAGQFLRPTNRRALASNTSNLRIMLGSWIPFAVVALAQTVILFAVVRFALGFEMTHPWLVFWFLLLVSLTFSALAQGFIALLDNPGKLIVLILLIVQLVTSGGLMPYETLPDPLRWLHHVLPMGYAITGVRRLAYGINEGSVWAICGLMVVYLLIGLVIGLLGALKSRTWTLNTLHPEIEA